MAIRWDPREVLDLYPESSTFTCSGTTKKGRRCRQFMISGGDLSKASRLLDRIARCRPKSRDLSTELEDLAYLTLCPRWHRKPGYSQVWSLSQKWSSIIDSYYASTRTAATTPTPRAQPRQSTAGPEPIRVTASTPTQSPSRPLPRSTISPTEPSTLVRSSRSPPSPSPSRTPSALPTPPSTPPTLLRQDRVDSPLPSTPTTTRTPSRPATPPSTPPALHRLGREDSPPPSTSTTTRIPSPPATPPASHATPIPTRSPVKRKPITEPCGICLETIAGPDDAVWCRAQCGQNIHRDCFGRWRRQCLREEEARRMRLEEEEEGNLRVVTCVFCRKNWKWEWEE